MFSYRIGLLNVKQRLEKLTAICVTDALKIQTKLSLLQKVIALWKELKYFCRPIYLLPPNYR